MKKIIKILSIVFFLLFLTGCVVDDKLQEDTLRRNIGEIMAKYKQGVNNLDNNLLGSIVSDQFSFYDSNKTDYLKKLFTMTLFVDSISYSNIRVENYKIFSDVDINGSVVFKPDVNLPLFKEQIPFLNGKISLKSVFAFAYEQDGLKILAEDPLLFTKNFVWGQIPPVLTNVKLSAIRVKPGDTIDVTFQAEKGQGNDVVFVLVNNQLVGGYTLAGFSSTDEVSYPVHVPADYPKGQNYDISVMAFGGRANLNNIKGSTLQGINIQGFSIPVR